MQDRSIPLQNRSDRVFTLPPQRRRSDERPSLAEIGGWRNGGLRDAETLRDRRALRGRRAGPERRDEGLEGAGRPILLAAERQVMREDVKREGTAASRFTHHVGSWKPCMKIEQRASESCSRNQKTLLASGPFVSSAGEAPICSQTLGTQVILREPATEESLRKSRKTTKSARASRTASALFGEIPRG